MKKKMIYAHTEFRGKEKKKLPDTQNHPAPVQMPLQKVGIRQFIHAANVYKGDFARGLSSSLPGWALNRIEVPADFSMYVDLSARDKGISMSRLPRLLAMLTADKDMVHVYRGPDKSDGDLLHEGFLPRVMRNWVTGIFTDIPGTRDAYIKAHLKIPKIKSSPKSPLFAAEYYDTTWEVSSQAGGSRIRRFLTVIVRYISTCPCSLHLSQHAEESGEAKRANPHMQPSYAKVKVEIGENTFYDKNFLFELIDQIEKTLVTIPYPMVKREDEQAIAIACGKHQMFCEDAARLLARLLGKMEKTSEIIDWVIVCDHDESIHSHFATSVVWRGNEGGLR